ncbi:hypothetical protein [Desulfoluna spongiiphila]|uniref:hypothetical protein n=1 Tax=Desulfoluna spongiiphila TaxID=419481 RepID=UPI001257197A|nr:hypothetical protein [Desulfoluna spongiiphila]VVS91743.1 hypothetical protein DBB_13110 [Desulfoluna spongiiphila]
MLKTSLRSCAIVIALTLWPVASMAFTPMSADALKATTGQALEPSGTTSTEALLQTYYSLFGSWDYGLSESTYGEDEAFTNGGETGELGILNWAYRALNPTPETAPSLFDRIRTFNGRGADANDQIPLVIMDIPRLIIIAPKTSYAIMFSSTDGKDDDKDFLTVTREASLMALQGGAIEVAAR